MKRVLAERKAEIISVSGRNLPIPPGSVWRKSSVLNHQIPKGGGMPNLLSTAWYLFSNSTTITWMRVREADG